MEKTKCQPNIKIGRNIKVNCLAFAILANNVEEFEVQIEQLVSGITNFI